MAGDKHATTRTELMGRFWLSNQLAQNRIEIANPARDIGVDLIAYDMDLEWCLPIQLKVINVGPLRVEAKYLGKNVGMVYVRLGEPEGGPADRAETTAYLLTPEQAWELPVRIGRKVYPEDTVYGFGGFPKTALAILETEFRVESGTWVERLSSLAPLVMAI
ncbi:hypothetical protein [Nocardia sp. NPDC059239]|uniref:hypothetical protein n=1 Tax=unclassified Nocardia TaxID=2637762 RepID=UPI003687DB6F